MMCQNYCDKQYLYIDKEKFNAHDILLCVRDGEKQTTLLAVVAAIIHGLPNGILL
jgi:DNA polymerase-3 subunit alpha